MFAAVKDLVVMTPELLVPDEMGAVPGIPVEFDILVLDPKAIVPEAIVPESIALETDDLELFENELIVPEAIILPERSMIS